MRWTARLRICCLEHGSLAFPLSPVNSSVWRCCQHVLLGLCSDLFLGLDLTYSFGTFQWSWFLYAPFPVAFRKEVPWPHPDQGPGKRHNSPVMSHIENEANGKPKIKYYLHSIFQEVKKKKAIVLIVLFFLG